MSVSKKILSTFIVFLLVVIPLSFMNLAQSSSLSPSTLVVTTGTNKASYYIRENVTIQGDLTLDGSPVSNACVAIQVDTPLPRTLIYRTLTIGNPTELWRLEITNMSLMDLEFNPINVAKIKKRVIFSVMVNNPSLTGIGQAVTTVSVCDANMAPIEASATSVDFPAQQSRTVYLYIEIPNWACPGSAIAFFNVYNIEPKQGGFPLTQEKTLQFYISRREQGWIPSANSSYTNPPNGTEGEYSTSFRLTPESEPGTYTLYASGAVTPIEQSMSNTAFNVESHRYPPQASFFYVPLEPYPNESVTFDASSSTAEGYGDEIIRYEWDFGDNTPLVVKTNPIVTRTFSQPGTYVVTLNVTDNEGLWSTTSKPISISLTNPTAAFEWTPQVALINQTVTFNATSSQPGWDPIAAGYTSIDEYIWNFGDNTGNFTETTPITTHKYTSHGNFTVTLTIKDSIGQQDTTSHMIQVRDVTLVGDITGPEGVPDGLVDIDDVIFVAIRFGLVEGAPGWDPRADITGPEYLVPDGLVDIDDVILVAIHFGDHL